MQVLIILTKELGRFIFILFMASLMMFSLVYFSPQAKRISFTKEDTWITAYSKWLKDIVRLNLGKTSHGEPVFEEIMANGKNSAFLITIALTTTIILTLFFLIINSKIKNSFWRIYFKYFFYIISGVPIFILGYFCLHISRYKLVSPQTSLDDPSWTYYLIPGLILGTGDGFLSEFIRHAQVEIDAIKAENYIQMAIAKGAKLWHHIKNDFNIHMSKIISIHIVILISGTVIIEYIFCLPGIGSLSFNAAENRETELLLGILICTIFVVILFNFINKLINLSRFQYDFIK